MAYLIIVGLVLYFFFKLVMKLAGSNDGSSRHRSLRQPVNKQINKSSSYQNTNPYGRSVSSVSAKTAPKRMSSFHDESIIEISPEPVPLNYQASSEESSSVSVNYYSDSQEDYQLGTKYKEKLSLTTQEVGWLNKFWNYPNAFNSLQGCEVEIIKLYLLAVKKINSRLKKDSSSLSKEIEALAKLQTDIRRSQNSYLTDYDVKMIKQTVSRDVYQVIYRKSEFIIREKWNHKRKIQADFYTNEVEVRKAFDNRLLLIIEDSLSGVSNQISTPDDDIEVALNELNPTRWRANFERIVNEYQKNGHEPSVLALHRLGDLNRKNPAVENIYFESSKFLSSENKLESLNFYLHYILHDLNSKQVDNKQLNKTIQKRLFSKQQEFEQFQSVVDDLVKTKDLQKALTSVSSIYAPKRRSIAIDISAVQLVEKQHAGTVNILNEYLRDENESVSGNIEFATDDELIILVDSSTPAVQSEVEESAVNLSAVQRQCLQLFESEGFSVEFDKVESFAKQNGLFKNQLIDGINDQCMELLDDVLIEENEEGFEINVNYYKKIFAA